MHHIVAAFYIADDVEAPKAKGVRTGYSPHHKFSTVQWLASGRHSYDDSDIHYPGETLKARIAFASWEHLRDHVHVGDRFEVRELDRIIGHGTVEEILQQQSEGGLPIR